MIVTKLGGRRPPDQSWQRANSPQELTAGVHDNLRNLGLDALDIVNYRVMGSGHGPEEGSIAEQVTVLAGLQREGLIRHIGLSNVTAALAWLLRCSPNILLIPGTSSVAHLRENLAAGQLTLPPQTLAALDGIAGAVVAAAH